MGGFGRSHLRHRLRNFPLRSVERIAKGRHVVSYLFRAWCGLWFGVCCGLPLVASALENCTQYRINNTADSGWQLTKEAACATQNASFSGQTWSGARYEAATGVCVADYTIGPPCTQSCGPSRYTLGSPEERMGPYCQPDQCAADKGKQATSNMTIGWTRKSGDSPGVDAASDIVGPINLNPTSACVGGCQKAVGPQAGLSWYSTTPSATGLYRISGDFVTTGAGTACMPSNTEPSNPSAPNPPCDGYSGVVNGTRKCVPPAAAPPASSPPPVPAVNGNPAAGSDGALPISDTGRAPPAGSGGNGGGPAAGGDGAPRGSGTAGTVGGGSGSGTGSVPQPGTGASGGGTSGTGTDGKNQDGGACERNPSAAGCGGTASALPVLYTGKGKTVSDVLTAAKNRASNSAIGSAATSFFSVQSGGTCPSWSARIPYINADVVIDQFCQPFAAQMFAFMRVALLLVASVMAFRIAIDN